MYVVVSSYKVSMLFLLTVGVSLAFGERAIMLKILAQLPIQITLFIGVELIGGDEKTSARGCRKEAKKLSNKNKALFRLGQFLAKLQGICAIHFISKALLLYQSD